MITLSNFFSSSSLSSFHSSLLSSVSLYLSIFSSVSLCLSLYLSLSLFSCVSFCLPCYLSLFSSPSLYIPLWGYNTSWSIKHQAEFWNQIQTKTESETHSEILSLIPFFWNIHEFTQQVWLSVWTQESSLPSENLGKGISHYGIRKVEGRGGKWAYWSMTQGLKCVSINVPLIINYSPLLMWFISYQ